MNQDLRTSGKATAVQRALTAAVAHIGAGRLDAAVAALEADGGLALKNPVGRNILGDIRLRQGRPRDALKDFEAASRMVASFPEAHANRGVALQALGRLDEALLAEERALSYRPEYATAHFNRGNVLVELGRRDEAIAAFTRAIKAQPAFPEALLNRGNALASADKSIDALKDFRRAIELRPRYGAAHLAVAAVQCDLRQFEAALAAIDIAAAADPLDGGADKMRARVLSASGRHDEALAVLDGLSARLPGDSRAHIQRAQVLEKLRRFDEALAAADEAVRLDPRDHEAHVIRGLVLGQLDRFDEQWEALDQAERLGAASQDFHYCRALALSEVANFQEALVAYDRAIALKPETPVVHYHRSFASLSIGDYAQGWGEHEWRLKMPDYPFPDFLRLAPQWSGQDVAGKKLLLFFEQGHGDTIQFARYAPLLEQRGARVTLLVYEALRRLFAESFPTLDVTSDLGLRSGFDYQSPLMSLAQALGTTEATIPRAIPYLHSDPERIDKWRRRLGPEGFRIGIGWQGNPKYRGDRQRSIPLAGFAPLAAVPGVRLISLQSFNGLDQLSRLPEGMKVETLGEEVVNNPDGFREVAAVMHALDLTILSDSAPAHLAGALGRPAWVALTFRPDWRWLRDRTDSPWYPTMRLFRQRNRGDWTGLFEEIATALAGEIARRRNEA